MITRLLAAALLSTASLAGAAAPEAPEPDAARTAPAAAEGESEDQEEKKVCRTERVTGSLTRRSRVCMTAAQWREVHDRTRRGVNEMNSSASGGSVCTPNPSDPFQGC